MGGTLAAVRAGVRTLGFVGGYHDPMKRSTMSSVLRGVGAGGVMGGWAEFEALLEGIQDWEVPEAMGRVDGVEGRVEEDLRGEDD